MTAKNARPFRAEVKAYLVENPEVIVEAMTVLNTRELEAPTERHRMFVANKDVIFNKARQLGRRQPRRRHHRGRIHGLPLRLLPQGLCRGQKLVKSDGNIRFIFKEFPILGDNSAQLTVRHGGEAAVTATRPINRPMTPSFRLGGDPTPETFSRLAEN